jgi:hypothetical protein
VAGKNKGGKKSNKALLNTGAAPEQPQAMFGGLEAAKAAELLASAAEKYGPSLGKAIYEAWHGEKVVFVEIRDSRWDRNSFQVVLAFHNLIAHGVYLNRFWAKSPEQMKVRVSIDEDQPGVSFDTPNTRAAASSFVTQILLATTNNPTMVWLDIPGSSVPAGVDFIELGFEIARLDDPASQELSLKVKLRGRP